jgi:hypothetical protein
VVKKMKETFQDHDIPPTMNKIEDSKPEDIHLNHIIGLRFPIAELSTYEFVWKFIKSLPEAQGRAFTINEHKIIFK